MIIEANGTSMQYIILIQNIFFNNNKQVDFSYLQIHPIAQKKKVFFHLNTFTLTLMRYAW